MTKTVAKTRWFGTVNQKAFFSYLKTTPTNRFYKAVAIGLGGGLVAGLLFRAWHVREINRIDDYYKQLAIKEAKGK